MINITIRKYTRHLIACVTTQPQCVMTVSTSVLFILVGVTYFSRVKDYIILNRLQYLLMSPYQYWCPLTSTGVPLPVLVSPYQYWCPLTSTGVPLPVLVSPYQYWCPLTSTGVPLPVLVSPYQYWCPLTSTGVPLPVLVSPYQY